MKKLWIVILAASLSGGCAYWNETGGAQKQPAPAPERQPAARKKQEITPQEYRAAALRRLDRAVSMLEAGNVAGATKALRAICAGKGVPGVTDEALFRLALLTLKPAPERPASRQGAHYLRRLRDEYPSSSWSVQAAPILDLLSTEDDLRQQNRTLRATNQNLSRKITELNESIQQLKHLDLELEQKNR